MSGVAVSGFAWGAVREIAAKLPSGAAATLAFPALSVHTVRPCESRMETVPSCGLSSGAVTAANIDWLLLDDRFRVAEPQVHLPSKPRSPVVVHPLIKSRLLSGENVTSTAGAANGPSRFWNVPSFLRTHTWPPSKPTASNRASGLIVRELTRVPPGPRPTMPSRFIEVRKPSAPKI